jgi:hypothetical protein
MMTQRGLMRQLVSERGSDQESVCAAYANAEKCGDVVRRSNRYGLTPLDYARRLYRDGVRKGWF